MRVISRCDVNTNNKSKSKTIKRSTTYPLITYIRYRGTLQSQTLSTSLYTVTQSTATTNDTLSTVCSTKQQIESNRQKVENPNSNKIQKTQRITACRYLSVTVWIPITSSTCIWYCTGSLTSYTNGLGKKHNKNKKCSFLFFIKR